MLRKFKQHLMDKHMFARLKLILLQLDKELQMTRSGGAVSNDYIQQVRKDGFERMMNKNIKNETRKLVTHNEEFRQYYASNRHKMRSIVNKAQMFADGAPSGVVYMKNKKLNQEYEPLEKIKKNSKRIHLSQEHAIIKAYNVFKDIKDSIFNERNFNANPTISAAVQKMRKRNQDDESDVYPIPSQQQ